MKTKERSTAVRENTKKKTAITWEPCCDSGGTAEIQSSVGRVCCQDNCRWSFGQYLAFREKEQEEGKCLSWSNEIKPNLFSLHAKIFRWWKSSSASHREHTMLKYSAFFIFDMVTNLIIWPCVILRQVNCTDFCCYILGWHSNCRISERHFDISKTMISLSSQRRLQV